MRKPLMNNFIWLNPSKWHKWFSWAKFFTIPSRYYYSLIPTQWYLDFLVHSGEVNCLIRSSPPPPITHKDPLAASHIATRRDKIESFYRKKDRARELNKRKERIFLDLDTFAGGGNSKDFYCEHCLFFFGVGGMAEIKRVHVIHYLIGIG